MSGRWSRHGLIPRCTQLPVPERALFVLCPGVFVQKLWRVFEPPDRLDREDHRGRLWDGWAPRSALALQSPRRFSCRPHYPAEPLLPVSSVPSPTHPNAGPAAPWAIINHVSRKVACSLITMFAGSSDTEAFALPQTCLLIRVSTKYSGD